MTPVIVEQAAGHLMRSRSTGIAGSDAAEVEVGQGMGAAEGHKRTARFSVKDGSWWLTAWRAAGETTANIQEDNDCIMVASSWTVNFNIFLVLLLREDSTVLRKDIVSTSSCTLNVYCLTFCLGF